MIFFFFNDTATTEIYTLSLHDALPILRPSLDAGPARPGFRNRRPRSSLVPVPWAAAKRSTLPPGEGSGLPCCDPPQSPAWRRATGTFLASCAGDCFDARPAGTPPPRG